MQVKFFMTPDPVTVSVDETIEAAWDRMDSIEAHHLPVTEDGRLAGIVSDRDLRGSTADSVEEVMTPDPVTVGPDDGLVEAAQLLLSHRISSVPVVDQGRLVGMLTTTNCLIAMIQLHHELDLATR